MIESPQLYLLAIAVVVIGLAILGFFMREGFVTSKIYQQGVKLYQAKDYKGAEVAFRLAIARHPSNDAVRLLLGEALMQQDKPEEAIATFKELIERSAKNADAHLRLGTALVAENKLEEAIAILETARDLLRTQRQNHKADAVEQLLQEISTQQSLT